MVLSRVGQAVRAVEVTSSLRAQDPEARKVLKETMASAQILKHDSAPWKDATSSLKLLSSP